MSERSISRRQLLQWSLLWAGGTLAYAQGGGSSTSSGNYGGGGPAPKGRRAKLYVSNSTGDDITVIDLNALKVLTSITVGKQPHGVAAQADGRRLFATVESTKSLLIIDTATDKILETLVLSGRPNQCASTPDGRYVAVPIRDANCVEIIDMKLRGTNKTLPVKMPHNCFNAGDNRRMFVTSMGENKVNMIDLKTMSYAAEIPVGGVPRPLAVTRNERTMYVSLSELHGFVIVDIPEKKVVQKIELPPANPPETPLEPGAPTHGITLTPDQKQLWVTSTGDHGLYIFDTAAKTLSKEIEVGEAPNWISFSPDGKYGCISNAGGNSCSILDASTHREAARLPVGKGPKRLLAISVPA